MFNHNAMLRTKMMLLAMIAASGIVVSPAAAQSAAQDQPAELTQSAAPAQSATAPPAAPAQSAAPTMSHRTSGGPRRYTPNRFSRRAGLYYTGVWGVDMLRVKYAESGEIVKFSYRVLDPAKAAPLNDKQAEPSLIDPQAGVKLVVPQLEKVGKLRQTSTPEAGRIYWMAFSNKGRPVKPGDRVSVVIGRFQAHGLVVD